MATMTADQVYEEAVKPLPTAEQLRLLARIASQLSGARPARRARPHREVMAEIRAQQRARGHQPRTREEIDADLQRERDSWGE